MAIVQNRADSLVQGSLAPYAFAYTIQCGRTSKGARLLDKMRPRWHLAIHESGLKLSSTRKCVLGQLFGDFALGVAALRMAHSEGAIRLGFVPETPTDTVLLRQAWLLQIRLRK